MVLATEEEFLAVLEEVKLKHFGWLMEIIDH